LPLPLSPIIAVTLPWLMVRSVFFNPEACVPGYVLVIEIACKKGTIDIGGKDTRTRYSTDWFLQKIFEGSVLQSRVPAAEAAWRLDSISTHLHKYFSPG